ncbi:MAG: GAF domain-containing protein [Burkholderiaceae bacterium]|nr:GAF domain-containing protein [Burkholderiaceae bacterium]
MHSQHDSLAAQRLAQISRARQSVLADGDAVGTCESYPLGMGSDFDWIERSWRRCMAQGLRPEQHVGFDLVSAQQMRRVREVHRPLVDAARPVLQGLGRATASTRYFAILTDADGVVVDTAGAIDHSDARVHSIARVGVDLSERSIGTSAISAALSERHPVWLHRGEHFFHDTSVYSCAGAPVFDANGRCTGMLDLTGIDAVERPELRHLVARAARHIENALVAGVTHRLLLRLNWPGQWDGGDGDGLLALDAEGWVMGANQVARQIVSGLAHAGGALHVEELFAAPVHVLFDAARRSTHADASVEIPLWSGLRVQIRAQVRAQIREQKRAQWAGEDPSPDAVAHADPALDAPQVALPLKDLELTLVHQAVANARGNVAQAARALGISRATVYRKLGRRQPER